MSKTLLIRCFKFFLFEFCICLEFRSGCLVAYELYLDTNWQNIKFEYQNPKFETSTNVLYFKRFLF
jgi:hypothetical protein